MFIDYPSIIIQNGKNGYGSLDDSQSVIEDHDKDDNKSSNFQISYRVVARDTLSEIASMYGTTYEKIAELNGISNPNLIYPGQVLRVL